MRSPDLTQRVADLTGCGAGADRLHNCRQYIVRASGAVGQRPQRRRMRSRVAAQPQGLHALDLIGAGEVLVIAARAHRDHAMIGDILSGHLRAKGAAGVIVDGAVRDTATLGGWDDFAVFSRHITPRGPTGADQGAVMGPVPFGGITVNAGDLILGDDDGLVCLPPATWDTGLVPARAKLLLEDRWTDALRTGSAAAAFGLSAPFRPA